MTQIERERLERNWETFQKLPSERQQHFRQLHRELDDDLKTGGNKLNHTLQTYSAWLQTLNPGQRADLRQAKSIQDKIELVRKFKVEQEERLESHAINDPQSEMFPRHRWKALQDKAKPFSPAETTAIMNALADLLPVNDRNEIERIDPQRDKWARYRQIVVASARQAGGPPAWPDAEQQVKMTDAIAKSERAARLKALAKDEQRRRQWVQAIFSSFAAELLLESAPFQPQKDELERLFEQLDHTTRETLLQLPPELMNQELVRRFYLNRHGNQEGFRNFIKAQREFQGFALRFLGESEVFGKGGPPGPLRERRQFFPPNGPPPPDRRDGPGAGDRGPRDGGRPRPPRRGDDREPPSDRPPPK